MISDKNIFYIETIVNEMSAKMSEMSGKKLEIQLEPINDLILGDKL